jgi:DMSO/TMAO reductase YedYZ molybdopterin-dependent catalytic subunit
MTDGYIGGEEKVKKVIFLAIISVLLLPVLLTACAGGTPTTTPTIIMTLPPTTTITPTPTATPNANGETEAAVFQGTELTPMHLQRNNALAGTQKIDRATYTLTVDGLVDRPLTLTYDDLLALPQQDRLMPLNCVEGWSFTAKWTGPSLKDIFALAGVKPGAKIVIFHTTDASTGYSSLDLAYVMDKDIIIALKDNDLTLPPERGFPFQVAAMSKYGYKWAKWVTRIELSDNTDFRGYWENFGYSNNGDDKGPAFEK